MKKLAKSSNFIITKTQPRLLIVDDQPGNIHSMRNVFPSNYEIFIATNGEQALKICAESLPDLILLDIMMPKMNGLELCHILKNQPSTQNIPIIFVTTLHSAKEETACWEAGAVDFVTKPVNIITLRNRVNVHLTLKFQNEYLRQLALIDGLTRIANRRAFDKRIDIEFHRAQRTKTNLGVIIIDVDFFKYYNDTYGHQEGDKCLCKIASVLHSGLSRATDLVARYGGEEFICLILDADLKTVLLIAEKLRKAVLHLKIKNPKSTIAPIVTISLGVAIYPDTPCKVYNDLIKVADNNLYKAKSKGRNQVCGP